MALGACDKPPNTSLPWLLTLIPHDSVVAGVMDWQAVRRTAALATFVRAPEAEHDFARLGLEPGAVSHVVPFGDGASGVEAHNGAILVGTFDADDVPAKLGGRQRGSVACDTEGTCAAALAPHVLVAGTASGVREVLATQADPTRSFLHQEAVQTLVTQGAGSGAPVRMFLVFSRGAVDAGETVLALSSVALELVGAGVLGRLVEKLGVAEGVEAALRTDGDVIRCQLSALMSSEGSAVLASGSLTVLRTLSALAPRETMSSADRQAVEDIGSLDVDRDGKMLRIGFNLPRNTPAPG
jgi:hypothetical protein